MSLIKTSLRHVTSTFLAGLVVVVPLIVVIRLGQTVLGFLTRNSFLQGLDQLLLGLLGSFSHFVVVVVTALIGFLVVFVAGMLLRSRFTKRYFERFLEKVVFKLPVVGPLLKSFYDAFGKFRDKFDDKDELFGECVLVKIGAHQEFGLLTETDHVVNGQRKFSVYIPGAPVPTAGRLVICDPSDVTRIEFTKKRLVEILLTFGGSRFDAKAAAQD